MSHWAIVGNIITVLSALFAGISVLVAYRMWHNSIRAQNEKEGRQKGRVDTLLEKVGKDISGLRGEFSDLHKLVYDRLGANLMNSKSPLQLTKHGKSLSEQIGALAWSERILNNLKDEEDVNSMDPYEIQAFCFEYVEKTDLYNIEEQRGIRMAAYKRGIETKDVQRVLAIELRDKLLEKAGLEVPRKSHDN